jgi:hypothetical protein
MMFSFSGLKWKIESSQSELTRWVLSIQDVIRPEGATSTNKVFWSLSTRVSSALVCLNAWQVPSGTTEEDKPIREFLSKPNFNIQCADDLCKWASTLSSWILSCFQYHINCRGDIWKGKLLLSYLHSCCISLLSCTYLSPELATFMNACFLVQL